MSLMKNVRDGFAAIILVLVASIVMIVMGIVYFAVTLFIIKMSADILDLNISGDFAILSASILTLAVMAGSSLTKKN